MFSQEQLRTTHSAESCIERYTRDALDGGMGDRSCFPLVSESDLWQLLLQNEHVRGGGAA